MMILGLTGSIGMGKSTVARMLQRLRVPIWDADAAVHQLYARHGAAVPVVGRLVPAAVVNGAVDRVVLAQAVLADPSVLLRLEAGVHPLVSAAEQRFLQQQRRRGARLVALDVPLLFEAKGQNWRLCHAIAVVSAPTAIQQHRVLARPGMTGDKLAAIRARQMPDLVKRRLADYVVPTGRGRAATLRAVQAMVGKLRSNAPGLNRCVKLFWIRKQLVWTLLKAIG